jgi:hypothetical protein
MKRRRRCRYHIKLGSHGENDMLQSVIRRNTKRYTDRLEKQARSSWSKNLKKLRFST